VAGGVLDQLTSWVTDAAAWATGRIGDAIAATTTPELSAGWYRERFGSMAALGLGLATLVAMVALISAAIRRDPDALGATVLGIFRAGVGTGLVLALVALALRVADGATGFVASEAVGRDASRFWATAADTWKKGTDDGFLFESSAVTFLFALVQAVAAILVWIELLLRQAAIYVAVLFLPVALAASIWPALRDWESRLARAVAVLVLLKPVMVIVLSLAGSAAAAAVTGRAESGVGVALAAIVIFALAALSPWALMTMVAPTGEGGWAARAGTEGSRDALRSAGGRVGGTIAGGTARAAAAWRRRVPWTRRIGGLRRVGRRLRDGGRRGQRDHARRGRGGSRAAERRGLRQLRQHPFHERRVGGRPRVVARQGRGGRRFRP
jgi:hypothetical protein